MSFLAGVLYALLEESYKITPYIWFLSSLLYLYDYWSYRKNGLLIIENNQIRYNRAIWKGVKNIPKADITNIEFQPKKFVINLNTGKTIKIRKSFFEKEDIPKTESIFKSFNE